jgi:AraC-like DNA-binding protein
LIYAHRGAGWVETENRRSFVTTGQIAWLDTRHSHVHGPVPDDPWEVYWFRFDGSSVDQMKRALGIADSPVFTPYRNDTVEMLFVSLFRELEHLTISSAATINSIVGQFLDILFRARTDQLQTNVPDTHISDRLARLHRTVLRTYNERWNAERIASELAMSTSHMYRVFNAALGMSPNRWIRSIRIEQARRRLVESRDRVGEIARQVGYADQFHFSKDFRALTGSSPREFRERERNRADQETHGNSTTNSAPPDG